jgi:hypothetical protein
MGKVCRSCGQTKSSADFYRHPFTADRLLADCKVCHRAKVIANRDKKADYFRAYDRERSKLPHRRAKNREVAARWRANNPLRRAAQVILGNAIRDGKVVCWPGCAVCDSTKVEAHHPDYDRPLDVVWLCPKHHKQIHLSKRRRQ